MRFVADERCDAPLVDGLRADGHDVVYIREIAAGADDKTVLAMAANDSRVLMTEDKDFGELVVRLGLPAFGVVLVRMDPSDSPAKIARLRAVIQSHGNRFGGSFTIVDESKIRIRSLTIP